MDRYMLNATHIAMKTRITRNTRKSAFIAQMTLCTTWCPKPHAHRVPPHDSAWHVITDNTQTLGASHLSLRIILIVRLTWPSNIHAPFQSQSTPCHKLLTQKRRHQYPAGSSHSWISSQGAACCTLTCACCTPILVLYSTSSRGAMLVRQQSRNQ